MTPAERQRAYRDRKRETHKQQPASCGTVAAYRRHQRRGEPIDAACREAHNTAHRAMYAKRALRTRGHA